MSNTHKGVILEIRDTKQITEKFQKRQFVVDQTFEGQYGTSHNPVVFSLVQEKCGIIDQFNIGDDVVVHFDLDSRAWIKDNEHQLDKHGEKSYFLDVRAWKVEPTVAENAPVQEQDEPETQAPAQTTATKGPTDSGTTPPANDPSGGFDDNGPSDNEPNDLPF